MTERAASPTVAMALANRWQPDGAALPMHCCGGTVSAWLA
jgi:hypothetical protein